MASADAAPSMPTSLSSPIDDEDEELAAATAALRAMTVDGEPDYTARKKAYITIKSRAKALWKASAEQNPPVSEQSCVVRRVTRSHVSRKDAQAPEYKGMGRAPKLTWKLPRQPSKWVLDEPGTVPDPWVDPRAAEFAPLNEKLVATMAGLEHKWAGLDEEPVSEEGCSAANKNMSWFLREAEKARDDPERENTFDAWDLVLPSGDWEAVYNTWSAEQDEKERQAAQAEADAAAKTKGKGKTKK